MSGEHYDLDTGERCDCSLTTDHSSPLTHSITTISFGSLPDAPLTEALAWYDHQQEVGLEGWTEIQWIVKAARKWADLEALVADGGRVVVEKPCLSHGVLDCRIARSLLGCPGGERRIFFGEGAE